MGYMIKLLGLIGTTASMAPSAIRTSIEYTSTPSSQYRICSGLLDTGATGCTRILRTKYPLDTYLLEPCFGMLAGGVVWPEPSDVGVHLSTTSQYTSGKMSDGAGGVGQVKQRQHMRQQHVQCLCEM